ncbi:uncharacterized protein BX664DRAFT_319826 [Halteromyces radiatus]|uniref:uncharacterized protein n=1 Tax=Halteromyces radiatus TaxID=101107 RepID=UPI00221F1705|nr:uncharacterized protein BX664DRAFT_319826 [Halteromyces radiatus]KAI8098876.1 hypothetical protein BX664DRAFT_319826 [Halteromyces radiatus]
MALLDQDPQTPVQIYTSIWTNNQLLFIFVLSGSRGYVGWCGGIECIQQMDNHAFDNVIVSLLKTSGALPHLQSLYGYSPLVDRVHHLVEKCKDSSDNATIPTKVSTYKSWSYQVESKNDLLWTDKTRALAKRAHLRLATWIDFPLLVNWSEHFVQDCGLNDGDMWTMCANEIKKQKAYFWCLDDGTPTAMVWKRRALRHGISVAYVYTPEESRQRGYAATMVAQFSEYLLETEGYSYVTLLVDGNRDPAKNMYTSIGYKYVGEIFALYY